MLVGMARAAWHQCCKASAGQKEHHAAELPAWHVCGGCTASGSQASAAVLCCRVQTHASAFLRSCAAACLFRDIKPQNLLVNINTHALKLCDFGSAKALVRGEPNISYICSRYYRAPELIFGATDYTCAIDVWSVGCVMAELLLGSPLFPGDSGVDQLVEIIKVGAGGGVRGAGRRSGCWASVLRVRGMGAAGVADVWACVRAWARAAGMGLRGTGTAVCHQGSVNGICAPAWRRLGQVAGFQACSGFLA